jgi:hypothetical protein
VVADRHPLVVGQQRRIGAKQLADGGGVVDAGVEIGVVADTARQVQGHRILRRKKPFPRGLLRAALGQALRNRRSQRAHRRRALRHQLVHVAGIDQPGRTQVQHLVANGHADLARALRPLAVGAKRQVLDGKSVPASLAEATQLRSCASWVALSNSFMRVSP